MSVVAEAAASRRNLTAAKIIDADVHNMMKHPRDVLRYLPSAFHREYEQSPGRGRGGFYRSRPMPSIYRDDSWPEGGGPPGSDVGLMLEQLIEPWSIDSVVLNPLEMLGWESSGRFAAALISALNDWMAAEWLSADRRFYGSIVVPTEDPRRAATEIRRVAGQHRFVQVLLLARSLEPLGSERYWPIYEAAVESGLPIAIHTGGEGAGPITGAGWPSYFFEHHVAYPYAYQSHVVSYVTSGIFDIFPSLQIVLMEGGFSWLPALIWRLDRAWSVIRDEGIHLSHAPSDYVRRHFYATTQPMDSAATPIEFRQMIRHLDMDDRILFASDYPHWDFDAPDRALPPSIRGSLQQQILGGNAASLYRFSGQEAAAGG